MTEQQGHILVVDDDRQARLMLTRALEVRGIRRQCGRGR